jgi:multidrug efflux pump subunit AcrA (membrane-fusion protein)
MQPVESIYLPAHAVGEDQNGRYVYVLTASDEPGVGVVHRRDVGVGQLNGVGELEITGGLDEGAEVVTAGVRRLRDGQRVRMQEAAL